VRKPLLTWPLYLSITFGVIAAVDLVFDVLGLAKATLGGIVFLGVFFIIVDLLTGKTPSQLRSGENG
jgi:hypothetical protein